MSIAATPAVSHAASVSSLTVTLRIVSAPSFLSAILKSAPLFRFPKNASSIWNEATRNSPLSVFASSSVALNRPSWVRTGSPCAVVVDNEAICPDVEVLHLDRHALCRASLKQHVVIDPEEQEAVRYMSEGNTCPFPVLRASTPLTVTTSVSNSAAEPTLSPVSIISAPSTAEISVALAGTKSKKHIEAASQQATRCEGL